MDEFGRSADRIDLEETEGRTIHMDDLCIATVDGSIKLREAHVEIAPGERILVAGAQGTAGSFLLNAIIGTWPWGRGRIRRPPRRSLMFLPAHAYVPPGTLRAALTYPQLVDDYEDALIRRALADMGLERVFSGGADFAGLDGGQDQLCLSAVVHKACVDVAEEGSEAAALSAPRICSRPAIAR